MHPITPAPTGVTITNPLILYRALLATKKIAPDPAQHRLAIHLQSLYERLKNYEPTVEYSHRLQQLSNVVGERDNPARLRNERVSHTGIWSLLTKQREHRASLALTRRLTDHETAVELDSPKGLMLHGEVGTGKSMLIDLFADCLPNKKKRRWHFNTFMLETFSRLEELRRRRAGQIEPGYSMVDDEYSLLWLARDLIQTSPILFIDEFQLPDRVASKLISNLMTSFFQLGGVLIATSNRMPEELDKAAGMEFFAPSSPIDSLHPAVGACRISGRSAKRSEFADFLEVVKARCDVWEMESTKDYRRNQNEAMKALPQSDSGIHTSGTNLSQEGVDGYDGALTGTVSFPEYYLIKDLGIDGSGCSPDWHDKFTKAQSRAASQDSRIPWSKGVMKIYGRSVQVSKHYNGVTYWTFDELCGSRLGPADYITLASTFHTLVLSDVPIMSPSQKQEARRLITLLDALYEAQCKLLVTASAGPDEIFFPESTVKGTWAVSPAGSTSQQRRENNDDNQDAVHAETFSEAYQDMNEPFRPNISSYEDASNAEPDFTRSRFAGILTDDALEDDPPNRMRRPSGILSEKLGYSQHRKSPDFTHTGAFTGQDEQFAYKRARSRLWEMCSTKWWARNEDGWWKPLPKEVRRWELSSAEQKRLEGGSENGGRDTEGMGPARDLNERDDEIMFRHGASPFRTVSEPPPKIGWTHMWGTVKWGKKAGLWGQGVDGLGKRHKTVEKK